MTRSKCTKCKQEQLTFGNVVFISTVVALIFCMFSLFMVYDELDDRLKDVPQKYCHNETITGKITFDNGFGGKLLAPNEKLLACEDGVYVSKSKYQEGMVSIHACSYPYHDCPGINKSCIIETTNEVCEIK